MLLLLAAQVESRESTISIGIITLGTWNVENYYSLDFTNFLKMILKIGKYSTKLLF